MNPYRLRTVLIVFILLLSACTPPAQTANGKLTVVATTSIVGDVARQIGGERVQVTILLPAGTDPHSFEPRPQDIAAVADADLVVAVGAGLEEFLTPLIESAGAENKLVKASDGIELLPFTVFGENTPHEHEGGDPHTWTNPKNVATWVENIETAFSNQDPANAREYRANADAYRSQLNELDHWIRQEVETIPAGQRKLVTDHAVLGYFAAEYGFEQLGMIVTSFSSGATPSAQELAALQDTILQYQVPAIFIGETVNPALAEQLAADTGVQLVTIYTGSLSSGAEADTYLKYMRYNVEAIVSALSPTP